MDLEGGFIIPPFADAHTHHFDGLVAGAEKRFFEPARLLRLATTHTARLIFPNRRVACLELGCEASFLVLEGDPLEDFSRIRAFRLRVKDGEPLAAEEIHAKVEPQAWRVNYRAKGADPNLSRRLTVSAPILK